MAEYEKPNVSVDIVPLTIFEGKMSVVLMERTAEPYAGRKALIGGYIHVEEDASAGEAARRVLRQKAGITQLYIEQLSTFSGRDRDPRGWSLSVAYFSLSPYARVQGAVEKGIVDLVPVEEAGGLPFDHDLIIAAAADRVRGKGSYTDLPARLLGCEFTMRELHQAYEIATSEILNHDAFRRKIIERQFIEETGKKRQDPGATKPASLYRLRPGQAVFERRF